MTSDTAEIPQDYATPPMPTGSHPHGGRTIAVLLLKVVGVLVLFLSLVVAGFLAFQLNKGWEGIPPAATTPSAVRHLARDTNGIRVMQATDEMLVEVARLTELEYVLVTQWDEKSGQLSSAGFQHVAGLPKLRQLVLSGCPDLDDDCLAALSKSPSIDQLSIDGCPAITADGIGRLSGLATLRYLALEVVSLRGVTALVEFSQVTKLAFSVEASDAVSLPSFEGMKQLEYLSIVLSGTATEGQAAALQAHLLTQLPDTEVEIRSEQPR